jgi:hypothetical protein
MSLYSKFWAPSSEIKGFLKGSAGDQVIGTCWLLISGLTLGLGTWGCLGRNSRRACFRKSAYRRLQRRVGMGSRGSIAGSLFAEEDKGGNGQLTPHGAFYLGPGLILWLN